MFVVGGGNYIEYQNLVDYTKVMQYCSITGLLHTIPTLQHQRTLCSQFKQGRKVLYGCSELFNSAQFIKQVRPVGVFSQ